MIDLKGVGDNDGIWAPTIRYHDGLFYIIVNMWKNRGTFYITAKDPRGTWSNPVFLPDCPGIDPSLFWDDDGRCYYVGTMGAAKSQWPAQVAIWGQELDMKQNKFVGERVILTYGHANNAQYAEGPHLYKIDGKYLLIMAEGGTDYNHAVTAHTGSTVLGKYVACRNNPVLSHRHLGKAEPIQAVGHSDLVQTQTGDWYAVCLAKRMIGNYNPLARETFLCKVDMENGTPVYNAGFGKVLMEQQRPNLPYTPYQKESGKDEFNTEKLSAKWYTVQVPEKPIYTLKNGNLELSLQPAIIDSLTNSAMLIQKISNFNYAVTVKMTFATKKDNEQAGLVLYRTANGYYTLLKDKSNLVLLKKNAGKKQTVATMPYSKAEIYLQIIAKGKDLTFNFGEKPENLTNIGGTQNIDAISDNKFNRFNGTGVGLYATSNGKSSKNKANYDWFEYKEITE